jgi:hypothetical protein
MLDPSPGSVETWGLSVPIPEDPIRASPVLPRHAVLARCTWRLMLHRCSLRSNGRSMPWCGIFALRWRLADIQMQA